MPTVTTSDSNLLPNSDTTSQKATHTTAMDTDKVSAAMSNYMLQGWTMLNDGCPDCETPLMRNREATSQICVNCEINPPVDPEETATEPAQATQPLPPPPTIPALTVPAPTTALPSRPSPPRPPSPQTHRASVVDPMVEARRALRPVGSRHHGGSGPLPPTTPPPPRMSAPLPMPPTSPPTSGKLPSGLSLGKTMPRPTGPPPAFPLSPPPTLPLSPPPALPLSPPPPMGTFLPQPVLRDAKRSPQTSMVLTGSILPPSTPPPPRPTATEATSHAAPAPAVPAPAPSVESSTIAPETAPEPSQATPEVTEDIVKTEELEPAVVAVIDESTDETTTSVTEQIEEITEGAEQDSVLETDPKPAHDPVDEAPQDDVLEAAPEESGSEPVQESVHESVQESVQDLVEEVNVESTPELSQEVIQETTQPAPIEQTQQLTVEVGDEDEDKGIESDDDFEDAEEEVFKPSEEEIKERETKREQSENASRLIGQKMLQGWAMLQDPCPNPSCHGEQGLEHGKYSIVSAESSATTTVTITTPSIDDENEVKEQPEETEEEKKEEDEEDEEEEDEEDEEEEEKEEEEEEEDEDDQAEATGDDEDTESNTAGSSAGAELPFLTAPIILPPPQIPSPTLPLPPLPPTPPQSAPIVSPSSIKTVSSPISSPSMGRSQREILGRSSSTSTFPTPIWPSHTMANQASFSRHLSDDLDKLASEDEDARRHIQVIRKVNEFTSKSLPPVPMGSAYHNDSRPMSTYSNSSDHQYSENERHDFRPQRHHSMHRHVQAHRVQYSESSVATPPSSPVSQEVLSLVAATHKTIATILVKLEAYRLALEISDSPKECQVLTMHIKGLMECLKACRETL
ncbi:hypothetical protein BGZ98_003699 [Dissophora globulifera]|nr:hypothetical protein BGZ98_003699 [Dissophora globulifera]